MMEHNAFIYWVNGEGYTPCTMGYRQLLSEKEAIYDPVYHEHGLDDLSPEEYQRYSEIENKLAVMQLDGHLGKSVRY